MKLPKSNRATQGKASRPASLEEASVKKLAEQIVDGRITTHAAILQYIETVNRTQETSCPICLNAWIRPSMSECGHVYCQSCIKVWETHCKKTSLPALCPFCRAPIKIIETAPPPRLAKGNVCVARPASKVIDTRWSLQQLYRFKAGIMRGTSLPMSLFTCAVLLISLTCMCYRTSFAQVVRNEYGKNSLNYYGYNLPNDASKEACQLLVDRIHGPGQFLVLPRLWELADRFGPGLYGFARSNLTLSRPESAIARYKARAKELREDHNAAIKRFFPEGTIFKIHKLPGRLLPQKVTVEASQIDSGRGVWYQNATVISARGEATGMIATLPANSVQLMGHEVAFFKVPYTEAIIKTTTVGELSS